jgi:CRP/FNR family transcriptional regulator
MPSRLESLARDRRRLRGGEALFKCGDPFRSLYAVYGGCFKTNALDGEGREQVTGFFMAGGLLGLDGFGSGRYNVTAVALEDSVVCVMPCALIEQLSREMPDVQHELHIALSGAIVREHAMMARLGSMRAEERLAAFLLELSLQFGRRGCSPREFRLPMTREDIGSYLGLTLETVSRLLSRFHKRGIVAVRQRHVCLLDAERLRALADYRCASRCRVPQAPRPASPRPAPACPRTAR